MNDSPIKPGSPEWYENARKMEETMKETITEHGHAVQGVFGEPFFAYTVGRSTVGAPDLYAGGNMDPRNMTVILNIICQMVDEGIIVLAIVAETGEDVPGVLANDLPVRFIKADPEKAEMNMNLALYGEYPKEVYQVLFPDPEGKFPGEAGYDEAYDQRVCPA